MFRSAEKHGARQIPGTDGLPCEFYKVFWNDVAEILIKSFNYSYEIGKLSISQRRGITLIPKKDAALNLIKNWRPITLLNCNYKIANRIKMFLPKLMIKPASLEADLLKKTFV